MRIIRVAGWLPVSCVVAYAALASAFSTAGSAPRAELWKVERALHPAGEPGDPPTAGPPTPPTDYDAEHYALRLSVHLDSQSLSGEVDMLVRSLVASLTRLDVDLRQNMGVAWIRRGAVPLGYTRAGDRLRINLDHPFAAGETLTVTISYSGQPLVEGFGCFRFGTHAGSPVASSLSEPWYARNWWPCKEDPSDKATADLSFTVPASMISASNGTLVSVIDQGTMKTFRWRSSYPIATYLISTAVTNYATFNDIYVGAAGDSMRVDFFAYPEDLAEAQAAWADEVERLEFFRTVFGEYPFIAEKYGIAEQIEGGMEHQTLTALPPDGMGGSTLLAHELAHQWWGDLVTAATWHDIWLSEGFATFSSALWLEHEAPGGYAAFLDDIEHPENFLGSVYRYQIDNLSDIFNTTTYDKAAWVLHMLRGVLGDSTFFASLISYRDAFAYASATTDDFEALVEGTAGTDLAWFFQEWVYGEGQPDYEVSWRADGPNRVVVHIDQVQGGAPFRMPIPITVIGTLWRERFVLQDSLRSQTFFLDVPGVAARVEFDPDNWVLETHTEVAFPAAVSDPGAQAGMRVRLEVDPVPSGGSVQITLTIPEGPPRPVTVTVHDVSGRCLETVMEASLGPGRHSLIWDGRMADGRRVAPGVYFVQITCEGDRTVGPRIVLLAN